STPKLDHCRFALVGPRSGPPCFLEPPTIVSAIPHAFLCQRSAPSHPLDAIKSPRVCPTVVATGICFGQLNALAYWLLSATRTKRGRSCGTPNEQALSTRHSAQ